MCRAKTGHIFRTPIPRKLILTAPLDRVRCIRLLHADSSLAYQTYSLVFYGRNREEVVQTCDCGLGSGGRIGSANTTRCVQQKHETNSPTHGRYKTHQPEPDERNGVEWRNVCIQYTGEGRATSYVCLYFLYCVERRRMTVNNDE